MYFLQPSQKRFLSSLNPILIGLFVYLLILFRTTSEATFPGFFRMWDLLFPFVIYVGQRRSIVEGLLLVLFMSHLFSLSSVAPIGVFAIHYLFIFLVARFLIYGIYANTWFSILGLLFLLGIVSRFSLPIIAVFFQHGWPVWTFQNLSPSSLFLNSGFGLGIYWILDLIDRATYKTATANIELSERYL